MYNGEQISRHRSLPCCLAGGKATVDVQYMYHDVTTFSFVLRASLRGDSALHTHPEKLLSLVIHYRIAQGYAFDVSSFCFVNAIPLLRNPFSVFLSIRSSFSFIGFFFIFIFIFGKVKLRLAISSA